MPNNKKAAERRRWVAYLALAPAALDEAELLLKGGEVSAGSRATLVGAVLSMLGPDSA
jgi:hypothetical protein